MIAGPQMLVGLQYAHAFWQVRQQPAQSLLEATRVRSRAWPWLCDSLGHINNARYLDIASVGRLSWLAHQRLALPLMRSRYALIVAGAAITYRREIRALHTFTIETQLAAYDERWLHFTTTLLQANAAGEEKVAARMFVRMQLRKNKIACGLDVLLSEQHRDTPQSPPVPIDVAMHLRAQEASVDYVRAREGRTERASRNAYNCRS